MERKIVKKDDLIRLITEYRQNELSYYQWCQRQRINAGTFYNWASKLQKSDYTIPNSQSKNCGIAIVQDVVKADLVSENLSSTVIEQNIRPLSLNTGSATAELVAGNVILRFLNGAYPTIKVPKTFPAVAEWKDFLKFNVSPVKSPDILFSTSDIVSN